MATVPPSPVPPDLFFLFPSTSETVLCPDLVNPTQIGPATSIGMVNSGSPSSQPLGPGSSAAPGVLASVIGVTYKDALVSPAIRNQTTGLSKTKSGYHPLTRVASPTVSSDGISVIKAPSSIILGSSQMWKNHLVAFFHGKSPSAGKIFADLNPIWGKQGRISVKQHSSGIFLIYIPCEVIRNWALEVGFWQSSKCSFSLESWSSSLDMSPRKLVRAPLWVLFKHVPPELWSSEGFSTIASGVGLPLHSESAIIKPYTNGIVKLRVVVELNKVRPSLVRVSDEVGTTVTVSVSYPNMPPKCSSCDQFGHLHFRCLTPAKVNPKDSSSKDRSPADGENNLVCSKSVCSPRDSEKDSPSGSKLRRSKSLPSPSADPSDVGDSLALQDLAIGVFRSSPPALSDHDSSLPRPSVPLNNSQFAEEEELIQRHSTTAPVSEKEVSSPNTLLESIVDPSDDTMVDDLISLATISVLENMVSEPAPTFVYINEVIESPILETAQISTVSDTLIVQAHSTVEKRSRRIAEPDYGSNKFASLISLEVEEDSSDSDIEMDLMNLMTPTGNRILRERPAKPSAKVRDMHMQSTVRGRGTRGRGSRGGRG